jgi:CHAD domain-containing protein
MPMTVSEKGARRRVVPEPAATPKPRKSITVPGSSKAGELNPDQRLKSSLRIILVRQAGQVFSYEQKILADPGPDAVHDMRVAARRLRALLRIFQKAFRRDELKGHVATLSGLIRSLGRVRDCDIIINNLDGLRHVLTGDSQASLDDLIHHQRMLRDAHSGSLQREVRAMRSGNAKKSLPGFVRANLA